MSSPSSDLDTSTSPFLAELHRRGLVAQVANANELARLLARGQPPLTLYVGFDPSSDGLHLGNLIGLFLLRRFQQAGHFPIAVAGGATGMIGDPSGKSSERSFLTAEVVQANLVGIQAQLSRFLDFETKQNPARLLNNADWTRPVGILDFLREVGKHFTVNSMMAKESVSARLESVQGISFTEFTYALLQANDFLHLYQSYGCLLQGGGSDQWGNITAGIDLIRRKTEAVACGLTTPLLTKADGTKFGKSEGGAVWLDSKKTSVYKFYQFLIQVEDAQVITLLKYLTFLDQDMIDELAKAQAARPERREAQKALAQELTSLVHGSKAAQDAERASDILFGGSLEGITLSQFHDVLGEVPHVILPPVDSQDGGQTLIDLLVASGLSSSKGQARKDIEAGGVYLNNEKVTDTKSSLSRSHLLFERFALLRKGKKNYAALQFE